jgi:hypothetical protein
MVVYTDHAAIHYLKTKRRQTSTHLLDFFLLEEFNIKIKEKKDTKNSVAYHLSRMKTVSNQGNQPIDDSFLKEQSY